VPLPADERYGVVLHTQGSDGDHFLERINVDWYLNFSTSMSNVPEGKNKVPFIRVPTGSSPWTSNQVLNIESMTDNQIDAMGFLTRAEISDMAQDSPGAYWYVFGEANRYGYITGTRWAPVFHYFITQIKQADPTAKIIGTSLLNWDFTCIGCGGYQRGDVWFQEFIGAYETEYGEKPEVDIWAIDIYPIDWNNTPNSAAHASIVFDQIEGYREHLDTIAEYEDTPIWITEIALHWGFDGWVVNGSTVQPTGTYHWDNMSDYLIAVLDWLEENAASYDVEKWFFYKTYEDVYNPVDYAGIIFFDSDEQNASRNCLGDVYYSYATDTTRVKCDEDGNTVPQ
jgi:hypothetical protein